MAVLAQLVEHWIVIPVVTGSNPVHRPNPRECRKCAGICHLSAAFASFHGIESTPPGAQETLGPLRSLISRIIGQAASRLLFDEVATCPCSQLGKVSGRLATLTCSKPGSQSSLMAIAQRRSPSPCRRHRFGCVRVSRKTGNEAPVAQCLGRLAALSVSGHLPNKKSGTMEP